MRVYVEVGGNNTRWDMDRSSVPWGLPAQHTRLRDIGAKTRLLATPANLGSLATSLRRPFWSPAQKLPPLHLTGRGDLQAQLVAMVLAAALRTAQLRPLGLLCRRFATTTPTLVSRLPQASTRRTCVRFATSSAKPAPAAGAAQPAFGEL